MVGRLAAAGRAVELGYAIEADPGPSGRLDHWAIAGIPRDVSELFSKRSDEIDAAIETTGFTSYQARGVAARETRRAKRPETQDALVVRWLDELDGIGWPARKLNQRFRIVQDRQRQPLRNLSAQQRAAMVDALIGPDGPLAERKAFTRADVIRLAAPRLYGYAAGELDRVVDAVTRHAEAIPLVGQPAARSRAWAAASALATEAAVADVADRMAHRQRAPLRAGGGDRPGARGQAGPARWAAHRRADHGGPRGGHLRAGPRPRRRCRGLREDHGARGRPASVRDRRPHRGGHRDERAGGPNVGRGRRHPVRYPRVCGGGSPGARSPLTRAPPSCWTRPA